ncbi:MAG: Hpt domain-containing protein [bacterium]
MDSFFTKEELNKLRNIALEELRELTAELDSVLDRTRKNTNDRPALEEMLRIFHTIGGSAALVGFEEISEIGTKGESMLREHVEKGQISPDTLAAIETMRNSLAKFVNEKTPGTK